MSLYLWINLLSLSVPFLVSFHPRLKLYKDWGSLFLAIFIAMTPFIIWDVIFTQKGFWGFNEAYLSGVYILNLPIEEWLFFICIPYACVFTHYALLELNNRFVLSEKNTRSVSYFLLALALIVLVFNFDKAYTTLDMLTFLVVLPLVLKFNFPLVQKFFITFMFMLIPFIIVNGILTGTGIEDEVVWYNHSENLDFRFLTIPIDDFVYGFSLLLLNLFLFEFFKFKVFKK